MGLKDKVQAGVSVAKTLAETHGQNVELRLHVFHRAWCAIMY